MTYTETVDFLYSRLPVFHQVGKAAYKANLDNILKLSEKLGNPHLNFKTVHVAGTNGKGSVSHMLAAIFQMSGFKTGLYTSPHLIDFCERIKIDGKEVPQSFVAEFVTSKQNLIEEINPSFFELITAMAFHYFSKEQVDIAIIETGLGGRLDATNIIHPELSVITNISYDHTDILGDTLEKIAIEKAGIIKENIPVVIGEHTDEIKQVFIEKSKTHHASIYFAQELYKVRTLESGLFNRKLELTSLAENKKDIFELDLAGIYQEKNIATLLAAMKILQEKYPEISEKKIKEGLKKAAQLTGLRGRWQVLKEKPLVIADTGHNDAGIRTLMEQIQGLSFQKLHIVFGMVRDKDFNKVLSLLPIHAQYYFTKANVVRALNHEELAQAGKLKNLNGTSYATVHEAIDAALNNANTQDLIFIGGSTFVAAEAIAYLS